jgi:hypothetical protein
MTLRIVATLLLTSLTLLGINAQDEPEYRMEVGAGAGMVSYQGDFNASLLKKMQPMGSLVVRYKPNPRWAYAMNASYGTIKGSSANVVTYYPQYRDTAYTFSNPLLDVSFRFEYNFWPYGTGNEYRGAKKIVPYVTAGFGLTYAKGEEKGTFTGNLPIGIGVRYKVAKRLNLSMEWVMHFSLSDKLDGVEDPYGIKSSGIFKNTDCYSMLQLALTYDIWAKCKVCHNSSEW